MAAMAGLLNHTMTAAQALSGASANPAAASGAADSSTDGSSDSSSATISANDFLSLLVTEMQNQDPTADTDPNEYINQLVQVNSLEQLIDINQNLSTALGSAGGTSGAGNATSQLPGGPAGTSSLTVSGPAGTSTPFNGAAQKSAATAAAQPTGSRAAAGIGQFANSQFAKSQASQPAGGKHAAGNLGIPPAGPAAHKVAHALDGHARPKAPLRKLPAAK